MDQVFDYSDGCRKIPECQPQKDGSDKKRELSSEEKQKIMIRDLKKAFCKGRYCSWTLR
jgi:hypothetical protein